MCIAFTKLCTVSAIVLQYHNELQWCTMELWCITMRAMCDNIPCKVTIELSVFPDVVSLIMTVHMAPHMFQPSSSQPQPYWMILSSCHTVFYDGMLHQKKVHLTLRSQLPSLRFRLHSHFLTWQWPPEILITNHISRQQN